MLGSLRVAAEHLDDTLPRWGGAADLDPLAVAEWLNRRPVRARNVLLWPGKAMAEVVGGL